MFESGAGGDTALDRRIAALSPEHRELLRLLMGENDAGAEGPERSGPVSFSQERMWVLHRLDPGNPEYNTAGAVLLEGRLDRAALSRMFAALIRRHETLRTVFSQQDGTVIQTVKPPFELPLPLIDLSALETDAAEAATGEIADAESRRLFSLGEGPLLRATLIRLSPTHHVVVFVFHHIIADGWSASILVREMGHFYQVAITGSEPDLPALPLQYLDFAGRQRAGQDPAIEARQWTYWREKLSGCPALSAVPGDFPRSACRGRRGGLREFPIPADLSDRLRALCRRHKVTMFVALLAAFKLLLYRLGGQSDLVVGTAVANRMTTDVEGIVGCFVNALPLRSRIEPACSFSDLLATLRVTVIEAFAHQELPFDLIVERLNPRRDPSHSPIFQTMFVYQNIPTGALVLPDLTMSAIPVHSRTARFDLTLEIRDVGGPFGAVVEYDATLFRAETIQALMEAYIGLLQDLAESPGQAVAEIRLRGQLSRTGMVTAGSTLPHLIKALAGSQPHAAALSAGGVDTDYATLWRHALGASRRLRGAEGAVVALIGDGPEMAAWHLGAWLAGAVIAPLADGDNALLQRLEAAVVVVRPGTSLAQTCSTIDPLEPIDIEDGEISEVRLPGLDMPACLIWDAGAARFAVVAHRSLALLAGAAAGERRLVGLTAMPAGALAELWRCLGAGGCCVWLEEVPVDPAALVAICRENRIEAARIPAEWVAEVTSPADGGPCPLGEIVQQGRFSPAFAGGAVPALFVAPDLAGAPFLLLGTGADSGISLLDADGHELPDGFEGELHVSGAALALGWSDGAGGVTVMEQPYRADLRGRRGRGGTLTILGPSKILPRAGGQMPRQWEIEAALRRCGESAAEIRLDADGAVIARVRDVQRLEAMLRQDVPVYLRPDRLVAIGSGAEETAAVVVASLAALKDTEARLAAIWADVLQRETIDTDENFFVLGGDSILSIQIAAQALEAGLTVTPQQLFEAQTVAELARLVVPAVQPSLPMSDENGDFPLSPIQNWLIDRHGAPPAHFNQALWFEVAEHLEPARFVDAVAALMALHPVLRLRVGRRGGVWLQWFRPAGADEAPVRILSPDAGSAETLTAAVDSLHRGLDPENGPIFQCLLVRGDSLRPDRVLMVVHHLATDAYSWTVLRRDLETACRHGPDRLLRTAGIGWRDWVLELDRAAQSREVTQELPFWQAQRVDSRLPPLVGPVQSLVRFLPRDLSLPFAAVSAAEATDLLFAAYARALATHLGTSGVVIDWEGHGRQGIGGLSTPARTVGWFTALYPLRIDIAEDETPAVSLRRVRERRAKVPNNGLGFGMLRYLNADTGPVLAAAPAAHGCLNYLGQLGAETAREDWLRMSADDPGATTGEDLPATHRNSLTVSVDGDKVTVAWQGYDEAGPTGSLIQLANRFDRELAAVLREDGAVDIDGTTAQERAAARRHFSDCENVLPLTPMQEGMLMQCLFGRHEDSYVEQFSARLPLDLDIAVFSAALREVGRRHGILRTAFLWEDLARPLQAMRGGVDLTLEVEECDGALDEAWLQDVLARDRCQGFELGAAPLTRWRLWRGAKECRLLWSFHHILLDGWSMAIVLQELCDLYDGIRRGNAPTLPPAPDFAQFLAWMAAQDPRCAEDFWRSRMKGFEGPSALPFDPEDRVRDEAGFCEERLTLDLATSDALRLFCREARITLNSLMQGAWAVLLGRHGATGDVTFGATASGRPPELPQVERTVGLFINTLPVRVRVEDAAPSQAWLQALQRSQAEARAFDHVALSRIHGWSGPGRADSLFRSILVFENYPVDDLVRASVGLLEDIRVVEHPHFVQLLLLIVPGREVTIRLKFERRYYESATVRRILDQYDHILSQIAVERRRYVGQIALLTPAECDWIAAKQGAAVVRSRRPVHQLICDWATRTPDAIAVSDMAVRLTYAEFDEATDKLARRLIARGVGRGAVVPVLLERGVGFAVAILAVLKIGGSYAPLDLRAPDRRLHEQLDTLRPKVVLAAAADAGRLGVHAACVADPSVGSPGEDDAAVGPVDYSVGEEDLAYILFTSGSTGTPNGVMINHRGLSNYLEWAVVAYKISDRGGAPVQSPVTFDLTVTSLLGPLVAGREAHLLSERDELASLAECLSGSSDWSLLKITPAHLDLLGRSLDSSGAEARAAMLVVGGDALQARHLDYWSRRCPEVRVVNEYGPTETVVGCAIHQFSAATIPSGDIPIGLPIDNTQIHILDPALRPVAVGMHGEIYIGGEGVARGYFGKPALTADRFPPDPFADRPGARLYRTGDSGWRDEEGHLHYGGRLDGQVKIRGYRIEPAEVERIVGLCAGVELAAVVLSKHRRIAELVAFVTVDASAPDEAALLRELKETLPGYMIPARVIVCAELPLTDRGKIDRKTLLTRHAALLSGQAQPAASRESEAELGRLEQALADIWKAVLQVSAVGLRDNFFDLGGHSLLLQQVQDRVKETLAIDVSLVDLFKYPTIRALVEHIGGGGAPLSVPPAIREREVGTRAAIAVIGMAGRFPGANSVEALWEVLDEGQESVTFFTREQLVEAGVSTDILDRSNYVRAGAVLGDVTGFDAAFFGMSAREADLTDPQHRLLLECCQEALDDAGYDPDRTEERIGVFAGSFLSSYLIHHLSHNGEVMRSAETLQLISGNDKDFLATRVSYKLGLRGPAVSVQTACSSSLVAVHQACESLRSGNCEMALAGGVSIRLPQMSGYLYHPDSILSADGHCRPFSEDASGFVGGSGCGIILLKRLDDAVRDGDPIRAVIKGCAINNDGARKVGFTAPSQTGQTEVIRAALADAEVEPASVSYVEAHGTATRIGDPIEIAALAEAYSAEGRPEPCAIGSIKGNIGHLDAAAGIVGLIKTILQLGRRRLVASLNCARPAAIPALAEGMFRVNRENADWSAPMPLRAGVSSFGMGGTNAHVIVEEAPQRGESSDDHAPQIFLLSAKSPEALARMAVELAEFLRRRPDVRLCDVAFTLALGRRQFGWRAALRCRDRDEAIASLDAGLAPQAVTGGRIELLFSFTGAPSDKAALVALWRMMPQCRAAIDALASGTEVSPDLDGPGAALLLELSIAALLLQRGLAPSAVRGEGVGEWAAAVQARRLSLATALELVGKAAAPDVGLSREISHGQRVIDVAALCRAAIQGELEAALETIISDHWCAGGEIDWHAVFQGRGGRRIPLPAYPFERKKHWIAPPGLTREAAPARKSEPADLLFEICWQRVELPRNAVRASAGALLCLVSGALGERLTDHFAAASPILADPARPEKFKEIIGGMGVDEVRTLQVLFGWEMGREVEAGLDALMSLLRVLAESRAGSVSLILLVPQAYDVLGGEEADPTAAAAVGMIRTAMLEYPKISCRIIDIEVGCSAESTSGLVARALADGIDFESLALRGGQGWVPRYPRALRAAGRSGHGIRTGGVYLIAGGGPVGRTLADHLRDKWRARIILVSLSGRGAAAADLLPLSADIADEGSMRAAVAAARARFGRIDGIFHCAGTRVEGALSELSLDDLRRQMRPKVEAVAVLERVLADETPDFVFLFSSLASVLGVYGFPAYASAHGHMDAVAEARRKEGAVPWTVVNFDNWAIDGLEMGPRLRLDRGEGLSVLDLILCEFPAGSRLFVSCAPLEERIGSRQTLFKPVEASPDLPEQGRERLSTPYRAPRTAEERVMAALWEEHLGVRPVGIDDDYFEVGGDSVSSLQIVARAREAGLPLTARRLFEHPTIAGLELAAATPPSATVVRQEEPVVGAVRLLPIQHWFFDLPLAAPHHWNLAGFLPVSAGLTLDRLSGAVAALMAHHDMLRCRFGQVDGEWWQIFAAPGESPPVMRVEYGSEEQARAASEAVQAGFDLQRGPLFKVVWFAAPQADEGYLLIVAHHLLVDALSWRILTADLTALLEFGPERAALPSRSLSVKSWADRLAGRTARGEFDDELPFWLDPARRVQPLPVDRPDDGAGDPESSLTLVTGALPADLSVRLVRDLPRKLGCGVEDLLLSLLAQALVEWTGDPLMLIDVEGLGRDEEGALARTVGWFTAIHPVLLEADPADVHSTLARNRSRLAAVPRQGIGHGALRRFGPDTVRRSLAAMPPADVSFVYLGQQGTAPAMADVSPAPMGAVRAPDNLIPYKLAVSALMLGDELQLFWMFGEARYERATVETLADRFIRYAALLCQDKTGVAGASWVGDERDLFGWTEADMGAIAAAIEGLND